MSEGTEMVVGEEWIERKLRARCLCGKARYATEKEAGRAAKRIRRVGKDRRKRGEWLIPYMCPERKGIWHVGHTDE